VRNPSARESGEQRFSVSIRPRVAVLDMIGTTVQSGDEVALSFREAFTEVGATLTDEAISEIRGRSKTEAIALLVDRLFPTHEDRVALSSAVYADFQARLQRRYKTETLPVPGADRALRWLIDTDIRVVLTTGLDRGTADQLVSGLGWHTLGLAGVISGDDVRRGRPTPDLIHAAMNLVGERDPKAVLAAGDTVADLQAAAAAGVGWSVGVLGGAHAIDRLREHPHSVLLESISELPRWLGDGS